MHTVWFDLWARIVSDFCWTRIVSDFLPVWFARDRVRSELLDFSGIDHPVGCRCRARRPGTQSVGGLSQLGTSQKKRPEKISVRLDKGRERMLGEGL